MSLTNLLLLVLVIALLGGAFGHPRYGYAGWSPAGVILCVLLILWVLGRP